MIFFFFKWNKRNKIYRGFSKFNHGLNWVFSDWLIDKTDKTNQIVLSIHVHGNRNSQIDQNWWTYFKKQQKLKSAKRERERGRNRERVNRERRKKEGNIYFFPSHLLKWLGHVTWLRIEYLINKKLFFEKKFFWRL